MPKQKKNATDVVKIIDDVMKMLDDSRLITEKFSRERADRKPKDLPKVLADCRDYLVRTGQYQDKLRGLKRQVEQAENTDHGNDGGGNGAGDNA